MKFNFTKIVSALILALAVIVTGCGDDDPSGPDSNPLAVESISPTSGQAGDEVTITGTGFASNADDNTVTFSGDATASISSASSTELVVTVPEGAATGPITVATGGESATSSEFTIGGEPQAEIPEPYASFPGTKIAADETWSNDTTLVGPHFVLPGVTLTIEAGVEVTFEYHNGNDDEVGAIYTLASDSKNFSEDRETAQLIAEGTANNPIVFTSTRDQINSWGGIIMTGRASNNIPGGQGTVEGIEQDVYYGSEDTNGSFNDSDNSGSLEYVRIEYAGYSINAGSELQSLTLYSIGSETNINHINLYGSSDDGVELFGGTVDIKYLVVYGADDDSFDYDQGWSGKGQFWLAVQRDGADQGFENDGCADMADCDGGNGPSSPNISNATVIAPNSSPSKDNMGLKLRESLQGAYRNIIVSNFVGNPFLLDGETEANDETYENYDSGDLVLENFVLQNNGSWASSDETRYSAVYEYTSSNDPADLFTDPSSYDYSLPAGSAYLSGGQTPSDSWFDNVAFRGAVGETGTDWDWVNEGIWVKWPI